MSITRIPYKETGYFSDLVSDYLAEKEVLQNFYHHFPNLENFTKQIKEKHLSVQNGALSGVEVQSRTILVEALKKQYNEINVSKATKANINKLSESNTFTITTGHQLNIFTGPLYFLYKIFSVINLSEKLNKTYSNYHFVPIYWMATEDHDFEEINYFNLFDRKIEWKRESGGAVGELSTQGMEELVNELRTGLGESEQAQKLTSLFVETYTKHNNLADATRYLANELFSEYGLVIIDGNNPELKKVLIPFAEKEFTENLSYKKVEKTTEDLENVGYKKQVHPREINLFYLMEGHRKRIIKKGELFDINETGISFTTDEILKELQEHPERFSPNALLRPLYQEVVLPNLCYVGGGGELAYWFQLKDYFESVSVTFPILLLRNSVLLLPSKLSEKLKKLDVSIESLFQTQHKLEEEYTRQISEINIDFTKQRRELQFQFIELYKLAEKTDKSFLGAVAAQEKKQLHGLDKLEKRLLKAEKRKLKDQLIRLTKIQDQLFPNQGLQERTVNFSEFYLDYGEKLLQKLKESLDPLCHEFTVLEMKS